MTQDATFYFKWEQTRTFHGGETDAWWVYGRIVDIADAERRLFNTVQFSTDAYGGVRMSRSMASKNALAQFQEIDQAEFMAAWATTRAYLDQVVAELNG